VSKSLVIGAVEIRGTGPAKIPARIRLRVIEAGTVASITAFVRDNVEEGSTIVTDGSQVYDHLVGYKHTKQRNVLDIAKEKNLPYFHTAISNLKAWLQGTHHG